MPSETSTSVLLTLESDNCVLKGENVSHVLNRGDGNTKVNEVKMHLDNQLNGGTLEIRQGVENNAEKQGDTKDEPNKSLTDGVRKPEAEVPNEVNDVKDGTSIERPDNHQLKAIDNEDDTPSKRADEGGANIPIPKKQQDILRLHGPGQRYRLDRGGDLPELKSDREILVKVRVVLALASPKGY